MEITVSCNYEDKIKGWKRKLLAAILVILIIFLLAFLIIWAVLRPTKPRFLLQDATVYGFNLTGTTLLTSVFQVTIQSRNPNDKISIYYNNLISYATYHDQQITLPTTIPFTYQDTQGTNVWSLFLQGQSVPIAPYIGLQLNQDRSMGGVQLVIKMDGQVKFKVGSYVSGSYRLHVDCQAFIPFRNQSAGVMVGNVKYLLTQSCNTIV